MATEAAHGRKTAGAFDIRLIIALLFLIYGLVLLSLGLAGMSEQDIAKSAGFNINLWTGAGMLVFAVLFGIWVWLRPIVVVAASDDEGTSGT